MPLALIPLLAVTFIDVLGFSILIPVLPFYAEHFGAGPQTVGLLVATVAIFGLISSPVLGALSDRVGRREILLITQFATSVAYVLMARASSLPLLFAARAVEGLSSGGIGVTQAYVADVTSPAQRAQAYGLLGMTYGIGFIFGPALSGMLVRFGYAVPFYVAAAISVGTIGLTLALLPRSNVPLEHRKNPVAAIAEALSSKELRRLLSVQFCFTLAFTMWVSVLALFLQRVFGFGPSQASLLYAGTGVIGAIMQGLVVGRLVNAFGSKQILLTGLVIACCTYGWIGFVNRIDFMIATSACWSLGYALARPTMSTLLSQCASAGRRGAFMGASDAINDLAFCIGPIVSTNVLALSPHLVGIIPALLVATAIFIVLGLTVANPAEPASSSPLLPESA